MHWWGGILRARVRYECAPLLDVLEFLPWHSRIIVLICTFDSSTEILERVTEAVAWTVSRITSYRNAAHLRVVAKFGVHTLHSRVLVLDTVLDVLVESALGRLHHEVVLHSWCLRLNYIE